jgi:hypothetical protein
LKKAGFTPLAFKIVPHQDKDVVARLEAPALSASAGGVVRARPADAARRPTPLVPLRAPVAMATPPGATRPLPAVAKTPATAAAPARPANQRPAWSAPIPRR